MKNIINIVVLLTAIHLSAQPLPAASLKQGAYSFAVEKDKEEVWDNNEYIMLKGIWNTIGNALWSNYLQENMNFFVQENGAIKNNHQEGYKTENSNHDSLFTGSRPVRVNDITNTDSYNAVIQTGIHLQQSLDKNKIVLLDNYFNNEWKKGADGKMIRHHYTWDDETDGGYSLLGDVFTRHGFGTKTLTDAPTAKKLKSASIYIIVDADTEKETNNPNYMQTAHVRAITSWVKKGGVLVLLGNDAGNAELKHFNRLAERFGIHFNEDNYNLVSNDIFEQGLITVPQNHPIFKTASNLFIKDLATLQVREPAVSMLKKEDKNIMAVAKYGRGTVFALGDPWLYNEYIDNRRLPPSFDNYNAATDLVQWLAKHSKHPKAKR